MSPPKVIHLKDYKGSDFLIDQVHLNVDLHEDKTIVKSILTMRRNKNAKTPQAPLVLNGEAMTLENVVLDGKALSPSDYQVDAHSLTILNVPDQFQLETEVVIKPQENKSLTGLYKSRNNFCTQNESHGFRRITYYLDRPDVMAKFTTTITADKDKYPFLLSNGNLIESRELSGNRHWVHWEDPSKKPCYLFALVAGDFDLLKDTFVTMSGRDIDLRLYVEKGFKDQGEFALQALKKAMHWDEETFGREYDLDIYMIVAVSDFNMGAMENKGLNIFNTKYVLANSTTATDMDYVGIENVIGHEYFHNWSGNRITCRDWFQITLKEGLTVLRDELFIEDVTSEGVARINNVNVLRNMQFPEDAGPLAHPIRPRSYIEVNNFYTSTVYRKGAEVIRMVRTLIGPKTFRAAMDLYFSRHDGQAVTTEDFIQAMSDASGMDLTQFRRWYDQAGTPVLDMTGAYDEHAKTFTLAVKQCCPPTPGQPKKEPMHLPLSMGLVGPTCQDMPLQLNGEKNFQNGTCVLPIKKEKEQFIFTRVESKPIPSLLRNFSAPVIVNYPYTDDELLWLLQCDSDSFARWEAGQTFSKRLIFQLVEAIQGQRQLTMDDRLVVAFKKIITGDEVDYGYNALLLGLPSINYLMQLMKVADVDAINTAQRFVRKQLANKLMTEFMVSYEKLRLTSYKYNVMDMGKRSLKNTCLYYLLKNEDPKFPAMAYQQFAKSDNMTDVMGALTALNNFNGEAREKALSEFYEKWKHQPLVVNKWFSLQASSTLLSTLDRVKALMKHAAFDIKNPNNVYYLVCTFGANMVCFHDNSGSGYAFIADQVLTMDPFNPQVASRVIQPLTRWQNMDAKRRSLMQAELNRISKAPKLSKDVYEIVTKSLT